MSSAIPNIGIVLLRGTNSRTPSAPDDIDSVFDQLRRIFRNQINVWPKIAVIDREVLAFNEAAAWQLVEERQ
jgi:hypothetical protein